MQLPLGYLTCTSYCNCNGENDCCNPYTQKTATTQGAEMDEAKEQHFEAVADAKELPNEDEEYDTETEFLTE